MAVRRTAVPVRHRYLGAILVLGCIVLGAAVVAMVAFANVQGRMSQMRSTIDAGFAADDAFAALVDEETGVRGFVATGDPVLLEPYRQGRRAYDRYARSPANLGDHTAATQARDFQARAAAVQRYFEDEIRAVREGFRPLAVARLREGKTLFDDLRAAQRRLEETLRGQIARNRQVMRSAFVFDEIVIGAMVLVVVAGGVAGTLVAGRGRIDALLARSDPVTELGNRRAFEERLAELIAGGSQRVGVVYIDLDRFKPINDRLGHAAGDELLAACGARLAGAVRPGDFVARIGGDEFAIVVAAAGATEIDVVCRRITAAIDAPFTIAGGEVQLGASIGHALFPDDGTEPQTIVRAADEAMFRAKRARSAAR
jgi:diguanylate cyclase (GGDEF)-like protein